MHRITLTTARARPILSALAAGLLAASTLASAPAAAQNAPPGAEQPHVSGPGPASSGEDFAAEFNRRFRDGDESEDGTATGQDVRPPYDPSYDDDDERGEDGGYADAPRAADEGTGTDENSGQGGAEDRRAAGPGPSSSAPGAARGCGERIARRVNGMLDRMEHLTEPTGAQQQAFEKLRDAAKRGLEIARGACPAERPLTPPGRLAAAEKRLETLLEAIRIVRPAMDDFFKTLSEEQKARFYAAMPPRGMRMGGMGMGGMGMGGMPMREHARRSLGDGRLDAWRDEMRRRWRERWSDDEGAGPRPERRWREHDDWQRGGRDWRSERRREDGWRGDDARRRHRDMPRQSRDSDDDAMESWDL